MPKFAPAIELATHEVANQPSEYYGRNLYLNDPAMRDAIRREAGSWLDERMARLGAEAGSEKVLEWGELANRHGPELVSFDRYGRRLDEVRFHPSYHHLMALAMEHNIHDVAWTVEDPSSHVGHFGLLALFTQAEAGTMCPINMTYAVVASLRQQGEAAQPWLERILGGRYDPDIKPIGAKAGITMGMAMTEKQGGSDVRANTTRAFPINAGAGHYRLVGHKWFCSAPMSDGFLTLAYTEAGLSCFLVPRITPDGRRNGIHVMRLKDKLGNKSNASSEIEYHDAFAILLGEQGRGVNVIIDMVHHTRLGTVAGTVGIMRMGFLQALHHVRGRRAFQKTLIDQPLMRAVIADLAVEYEAAAVLGARVARMFGGSDPRSKAFARIAVALAKYWLTKRNPNFVFECMECHGGAGYVEETPMPRLFRESPLNAIWEGSGNVIVLDVLRTLRKEPEALAALFSEIEPGLGRDDDLDMAVQGVKTMLDGPLGEGAGRLLVERLALVLQGALLVRFAPAPVARAFCATRLGGAGGHMFGVMPEDIDVDGILDRHLAALDAGLA